MESSSIPVTARSVPSQVLRIMRVAQLADSMMFLTDSGNRDCDRADTTFMVNLLARVCFQDFHIYKEGFGRCLG